MALPPSSPPSSSSPQRRLLLLLLLAAASPAPRGAARQAGPLSGISGASEEKPPGAFFSLPEEREKREPGRTRERGSLSLSLSLDVFCFVLCVSSRQARESLLLLFSIHSFSPSLFFPRFARSTQRARRAPNPVSPGGVLCSVLCSLARVRLVYLKGDSTREGGRKTSSFSMAASTAARRSSLRRRRRCSSPTLLALLPLAVVALASAGALAQVRSRASLFEREARPRVEGANENAKRRKREGERIAAIFKRGHRTENRT